MNPELAQLALVLTQLEAHHPDRLAVTRAAMVRLYRERLMRHGLEIAGVSADDARRWLRDHPEYDRGNHNWLGALFRAPGWVRVGRITSTTPGSHGNELRRWAWTSP